MTRLFSPVKYYLVEAGARVPAHDVAERNGIPHTTFLHRIETGWSVLEAATKPIRNQRNPGAEKVSVHFILEVDLLAEIDEDRGEESRAAWITRMARDQLSRNRDKQRG